MHPADINAALIKRGMNQTKLAALIGVEQNLVSSVIHGTLNSRPVATAISGATGIPLADLWPGQYDRKPGRKPARAAA